MGFELAQRREPIRSRFLLDSANGAPCTLRFQVCVNDPRRTVSCHITDRSFGLAQKADDCSTVHGCDACHAYLDRRLWIGELTREQVLEIVLAAVLETQSERLRSGRLWTKLDTPKPFAARPTKPRKPAEQRRKIPAGRKLQSRNNLRRNEATP